MGVTNPISYDKFEFINNKVKSTIKTAKPVTLSVKNGAVYANGGGTVALEEVLKQVTSGNIYVTNPSVLHNLIGTKYYEFLVAYNNRLRDNKNVNIKRLRVERVTDNMVVLSDGSFVALKALENAIFGHSVCVTNPSALKAACIGKSKRTSLRIM